MPTDPDEGRAVLIVNPRSGGGKAQRYNLVGECGARGIEPIVLGPEDDIGDVAATAALAGAGTIGAAAGDGGQARVAAVAAQYGIAFVCVPAGTRNHFALDIGVNRREVVHALDAFHDGYERRVDLARVNGRTFVNNASMGWYGKVVQSPAYRDAKLKTVLEMLPELLGPRAEPFPLRFTGPQGDECSGVHLLLVSNNCYQFDRAPRGRARGGIDQGTLGVIAARMGPGKEIGPFRAISAEGGGGEVHGWREWALPSFRVDADEPVDLGLDGEALTIVPPLLFESVPLALKLRLPARHARRARATLPPTSR